jgi:hypothetical protein
MWTVVGDRFRYSQYLVHGRQKDLPTATPSIQPEEQEADTALSNT